MTFTGRSTITTSRPEGRDVTEELERRFREQEAADQAAKSAASQSAHPETPAQAHP